MKAEEGILILVVGGGLLLLLLPSALNNAYAFTGAYSSVVVAGVLFLFSMVVYFLAKMAWGR